MFYISQTAVDILPSIVSDLHQFFINRKIRVDFLKLPGPVKFSGVVSAVYLSKSIRFDPLLVLQPFSLRRIVPG